MEAFVEESKISIHPQAEEQAIAFGINPVTCALNGGEDYELLFTVDQKDFPKIKGNPNFTVIGYMKEKNAGVNLVTRAETKIELKAQGWKNFSV